MTPPMARCVQVRDVRELPRRINEAFKIATSGRPGPVIVDLPKDVTAAICNEAVPTTPQLPGLSSEAHAGGLTKVRTSSSRAADLLQVQQHHLTSNTSCRTARSSWRRLPR